MRTFLVDKKWPMSKPFTWAKYTQGLFWEVKKAMKKSKITARKTMIPDQSALEGIPTKNPHADFAKKDKIFKQRRGAQQS